MAWLRAYPAFIDKTIVRDPKHGSSCYCVTCGAAARQAEHRRKVCAQYEAQNAKWREEEDARFKRENEEYARYKARKPSIMERIFGGFA